MLWFVIHYRCLAISKGNVLKVLEGIGDTIHTRSTVKLGKIHVNSNYCYYYPRHLNNT